MDETELLAKVMKNMDEVQKFIKETPATVSVKDLIDGIMDRLMKDV